MTLKGKKICLISNYVLFIFENICKYTIYKLLYIKIFYKMYIIIVKLNFLNPHYFSF